jgi:hypothetical protein
MAFTFKLEIWWDLIHFDPNPFWSIYGGFSSRSRGKLSEPGATTRSGAAAARRLRNSREEQALKWPTRGSKAGGPSWS